MSMRSICMAMLALVFAACAQDRSAPPPLAGAGPSLDVEPATGRVTSTDDVANAPTFLWADRRATAATRPANARDAARRHVASFASYYRLTRDQVGELELRDLHDTGRGPIIALDAVSENASRGFLPAIFATPGRSPVT